MFVITIPSSDKTKGYTVRKSGDVWVCDCKGHVFHSKGNTYTCRHIAELAASLFAHVSSSEMSGQAKASLGLLLGS